MGFFERLIEIFLDMSLYMLIGMILAGVLHAALKRDTVVKHLGKGSRFAAVKAALFGVPLPLCSCGVLPAAVYLGKNGANTSAAMAFLISTPQTGIDSIIATAGMMGAVFAVYRPLVAFISGAAGGALIQKITGAAAHDYMVKEEPGCSCGGHGCGDGCGDSCDDGGSCGDCGARANERSSFRAKLKSVFRYAFVDFMDDISLHFAVGAAIAAAITLLIPEGFFADISIGSGILGMLLMLVIGLPMYICSTSSIPVALALMAKGISPGAAFVFLFAGPATNAASLSALVKVFGKKTVAAYVAVTAAFAVGFGILLDLIIEWFSLPVLTGGAAEGTEEQSLVRIISGILFGALLLRSLGSRLIKSVKQKRAAGCKQE